LPDRALAQASKGGSLQASGEARQPPAPRRPIYEKLHFADIRDLRDPILTAIATLNDEIWMPEMSHVANPKYRRSEVLVLLRDIIRISKSWDVRIIAATYLVELGATDGPATLINLLGQAMAVETFDQHYAVYAVDTLTRYGYQVPPDIMAGLVARYHSDEMNRYAALQGAPEIAALLKGWGSARNTNWFRDTELAVFLGLNDADSLARFTAGATNPLAMFRLTNVWGLYQATGEKKYLDILIASAENQVGAGPTGEKQVERTAGVGLTALMVTVEPESTKALEEIVNYLAVRPDLGDGTFARSLESLYYYHHDFAFVDQKVADYFSNPNAQPGVTGISGEAVWHIAAAEQKPEIADKAYALSRDLYEQYFLKGAQLPVESWAPTDQVPLRFIQAAKGAAATHSSK
jgi:hypothetical protein